MAVYKRDVFSLTGNYHSGPSACMDHFDELMKDIKEPQIFLCQSEVFCPEKPECKVMIKNAVEGRTEFVNEEIMAIKDIIQNFECIICKGIPINGNECSNCEVLFCRACIDQHQINGIMGRRCPQCKQNFTVKSLNRNLSKLTIEKLMFRHTCMPKELDKEESAFEKFKETAKYREIQRKILIKQGKNPPPLSLGQQPLAVEKTKQVYKKQQKQQVQQTFKSKRLQKQIEDKAKLEDEKSKNENEKQKKIEQEKQKFDAWKKELKDREQEDLQREQVLGYSDYLYHLRHDNCPKFAIFECPAKCSMDTGNNCVKQFNYQQLKTHLLHECPKMMMKCRRCNYQEQRCNYPHKHDSKQCMQILKEKEKAVHQEFRECRKRRRDLIEDYNDTNTANQDENSNVAHHPYGYQRQRLATDENRSFYDMYESFMIEHLPGIFPPQPPSFLPNQPNRERRYFRGQGFF